MEARIINYRRGRHTEYTDQFILKPEGVENKDDALKLVGKKVVWKTVSGKEIRGKITKTHGNKGEVLARFMKGLPGQALGKKVEII